MTEETLFHEALARPAAERAAFLEAACTDQPELRAAVDALLAAHEASASLLDRPAAEMAQTIDSQAAQPPHDGAGEYAPPPKEASRPQARTVEYLPNGEPGAVIAGRYTLVKKLGEGGMGEVWVAKQTEPVKRKVALKLIKTGMDSKAVLARFEQERQTLALMDHPNIARVLDGGMTRTGQPFFVMELVNGLPLNRFCDEARLPPRERLELFVAVCQAVQHAHNKGIVHRDLKPANILVTLIDGRPAPKVIDFGVAKATAGKLTDETMSTQFGAVVGTLEYMSPEQAGYSGDDIDTRADIYSLGVILYELLTGLRPIDAARLKKAALTEMIRMIQEEEPSKPSTRLSTDDSLPSLAALRQTEPRKLMALLRGELDWVVMKCLEKRRDRRYETANGLARDIQRYLADEPVEARPPSAGYRFKKFASRNKGQVIAASLVLVALVVGMVGTTWGLVEAKRQEGLARTAQTEERARAESERRAKQAVLTAWHKLARIQIDTRQFAAARADASELIRLLPKEPVPYQVLAYVEFKRLFAEAQFAGLSGNREDQLKARELLQELLALNAEIRDRTGRGAAGLPPLDARQRDLFREDQFNALFLAAFVEEQSSLPKDPNNPKPEEEARRKEALQRAIGWQNEAAQLFPETKALYIYRALNWGELGNTEAKQADLERAESIKATSAVDHFWHGFAEVLRAKGAMQSGNEAESQEHYRKAIAEYASYLQINPRDSSALTQWAACHVQLGEFSDALVGLTSAIDFDPDRAMAYVNRGIVEVRLHKVDDALADFERALALDDHCADAYYNRAVVEMNRQEFEAALDNLNHVIEYKPTFEDAWLMRAEAYRRMGRDEKALEDLGRLIEFARNPVAARLMRANLFLELRRILEAEADYDASLDHAPDNLQALRKRAELGQKLNRREEELADLDEVLRLDPDDVQSLQRHAKLNFQLKHDDAALADYSRLIELQHNLAENYRARAKMYRRLRRRSESIDDFRELVKLEPNDAEAWRWLALIEFNLAITESNAKQLAAARADASEVIRLRPKWALPYKIRALAGLRLEEFDNSLGDWPKLVELAPEDFRGHYYIGRIEMARRNYGDAAAALKRVIALKPDFTDAHWALAETLLLDKRYPEALNETNLLIDKFASDRPAVVNSRGDVFRAMGDLESAAADYREFFNRRPLDPNDVYFAESLRAANSAAASLAGILDLQGKSDEARACFDELVAAAPTSAAALLARAQDRRNHGRLEEAFADCDAAAEMDGESLLPGLAKASIIAAMGYHATAVAEAKKLLAGAPSEDGRVLWAAARVWSLASAAAQREASSPENAELAAAYADRAADLLADVLGRRGFDLTYPERNRLLLDPALAAVRDHPRVVELLGK